MRTPFQFPRLLICLGLLFSAQLALSMPPQTGIYWNPRHPGTGMYLENQNGTVFAVLFGYSNADSDPEFYVSSGAIIPSVPADFIPRDGLYPIEGFGAPIFRVPSGPCLACPYAPIPPAERVGTLQIMFHVRGAIFAKVFFSDGRVFPNPEDQLGEIMVRTNYSLGGTPTAPEEEMSTVFTDVRGEWVFTDQSDPMRPAWRFNFSTREEGIDLSDFPLRSSVAFRDTERNAVFYCFAPNVDSLTNPERQATPQIGCEVRQDGTALFWSPNEIAIDEFHGSLGAMPPRSAGVFRSPQRVIGRRISD